MFGSRNFLFARSAAAVILQNKLFSWGQASNYGQLGLGDKVNKSSPVQVGALTDWATPAGGGMFSLCTKNDGTLWSWGQNIYQYTLGTGNNINRSSPVQVGALTNWDKPSANTYNGACIKTDGTLWTWGQGGYGQIGNNSTGTRNSPVQVGSSTTWTAISVGRQFMVAVDNGKLFSWGNNNSGRLGLGNTTNYSSPVQVGALTNWATPAVGMDARFTLCTKTDGTLWAWGFNGYGRLGLGDTDDRSSPTQVGALTDWATPAGGRNHALCVKTDGTLWAWGVGSYGVLGTGNTTYRSSPVQVGALTNWAIPSANINTSFCLKTDGTLWAWGLASPYGQTGLGNTTVSTTSPVQIGSLTSWSKVSGGRSHTLATFAVPTAAPVNLTVPVVSGTAQDGQTLSSTTGTWSNFPDSFAYQWQRGTSDIVGATSSTYEVVTADVGSTLRCVVTATNGIGSTPANSANTATVIAYVGKLFSWGMNIQTSFPQGTLGLNDVINRSSPVQVGAQTDWLLINSPKPVAAVKTTGQLWQWGSCYFGELGQSDTVYRSSPVQVGALTTWAKPGGGSVHTLCTRTDGTLWAWGNNGQGKLGLGNTTDRSSPVQVGSLTNWATPSTGGGYSSLCVKTDGTLWVWGQNDLGTLGLDDTANRSSPVQVGALTNWKTPVCSGKAALCVKTDGTLWAWGNNSNGQLGLNNIANCSSPVQVGSNTNWKIPSTGHYGTFSACTTTNGQLFTWGNGANGRLGHGNTTSRSSPVQVGALTNWSVAQAGIQSCVAAKTDGTLWSWGGNNIGTLGQNDAIERSSPVQVGSLTTWLVPSLSYRAVLCTQR